MGADAKVNKYCLHGACNSLIGSKVSMNHRLLNIDFSIFNLFFSSISSLSIWLFCFNSSSVSVYSDLGSLTIIIESSCLSLYRKSSTLISKALQIIMTSENLAWDLPEAHLLKVEASTPDFSAISFPEKPDFFILSYMILKFKC